jgi:hypothetical protein
MPRTFIRQDAEISSTQDTIVGFDDNQAPAVAMESAAALLSDDLNNIRSILNLHRIANQSQNWYDDLTAPVTLEAGVKRGIDALNNGLHLVEKKRVLRDVVSLVDITVPGGQNWKALALGELPSNTTAAVGAVSTLGTVAAFNTGTFDTHSLDEVAGANPINPKNLMDIVDGATRDPITSSSRQVYALFQTETATDGQTLTGTTPNRAQISFVRLTAAGDDLEACPVADIAGKTINYATRERVRLEGLNEQDFLKGAALDSPGTTTTTRQTAYDNQGITAVELTTNATLDLNSAGIAWKIRDLVNADLFTIVEGSTGGTSEVQVRPDVDVFNVDAVINDFSAGVKARTGGTRPINVGVTDGAVETTAGDLTLKAFVEFDFVDTNKSGSTFGGQLKLSDTSAEWSAYETQFGEVSLLSAIVQASKQENRTKGVALVTPANIAANVNVSGVTSPNIDAALPDYSFVASFVNDVDVFLNGVLMRNGADASANNDVYPGTTPADGDLKFEFQLKGTGANKDVITMIVWGET